jgi:hypothetical protein
MGRVVDVLFVALVLGFVALLVAIYPVSDGCARMRFDHPPVTVVPPTRPVEWRVYLPVVLKERRRVYLPVVLKEWSWRR